MNGKIALRSKPVSPVQPRVPPPLPPNSVVFLVKENVEKGRKERNEGKRRYPGGHMGQ